MQHAWWLSALVTLTCSGADLELAKRPFLEGREYFVLRSGTAQLIVQTERADVGPAFTFLLFDAQNADQSKAKERAANWDPEEGAAASALIVEVGGFAFTALGHNTVTRWAATPEGLPAAEAVWWAGGIRVTEQIFAVGDAGTFGRSVRLEGQGLAGPVAATLKLSEAAGLSVVVLGEVPFQKQGVTAIGPLTVMPSAAVAVETVMTPNASAAATWAQERAATRERWMASSRIETSDRTVQELFDKARWGLPGMIAGDGTMNAGIFEYGRQWVRDTSNTALGAIHAGHFELARAALEHVLGKMIAGNGATMIASAFDAPDREQFDQMGELLHVLKSYVDWTGDDSLARKYRAPLLAAIERPLHLSFRDSSGMVHNRREFWERTFQDGYELAYQTWMIQGLRDAAALAGPLEAGDRAARWQEEAGRMLAAMLSAPGRALVDEGHLIKRRNADGSVADAVRSEYAAAPDVPARTEPHQRLRPDASQALPIAFRLVDPRSDLARRTLEELEQLWNARWTGGGYGRYHASTEGDQPGPWTFATCFVLRAEHEARMFARSRRSLEWLNTVQGGRTGFWFEEIPVLRSTAGKCGLIPWTSAEIALFVVRHLLGLGFEGDTVVLRPALYPGSPPLHADLRFRKGRLRIEVDGSGPVRSARVNGAKVKVRGDGAVALPKGFESGTVILQTKK